MEAIEYELEEGRAYALGQAGKKLEAALAALEGAPQTQRDERLDDAAEAAWSYMILRETAGFYDHDHALGVYGVPAAVRARIGIVRKR